MPAPLAPRASRAPRSPRANAGQPAAHATRPKPCVTLPASLRRRASRAHQGRVPPARSAESEVSSSADAGEGGPMGATKPSKAKSRAEWLQTFLKRFKPMTEKTENATVLPFEKPLFELDQRIMEVKTVAEENGVDVSGQVEELEARASQLRKETYSHLTPMQRLLVARHPNRPTFLDIALNITDKFVELHGDRHGYDDPSLVCGLGSISGQTFMLIGHQKGRNTKENIHRNFGMPTPNGYRKALRFMEHADKFGFPIVTFVDTPGAYAGLKAEELGQGEAIAYNLRQMFNLKVPMISIVIGEGGSGGALAIGCANKMMIMEHAVYYVASPEACAAILWKTRDKTQEATENLRITSKELSDLGIMDEVIPEPLGAAHSDPISAFAMLRESLLRTWAELETLTEEQVRVQRYTKFRKLGQFIEDEASAEPFQEPEMNRDWMQPPAQPDSFDKGYVELLAAAAKVVEMEEAAKKGDEKATPSVYKNGVTMQ